MNCIRKGSCLQLTTRALTDKPEQSAREWSLENAYYERHFLIKVTCNMNAKGQTWNENTWTVTKPSEWKGSELKT